MGKKYGFGIVGTGMISEFHAKAILELENARLVGIYSRTEEKAKKWCEDNKFEGIKPYWDLEKFLSDPEIDVITICTPSGAHLEPTVKAAEFGKHVICEKPLEVTLERVDRMIEAHKKAGTKLGGIFNSRYEPVNQMIKKTIESGRLGKITYAGGYIPWWRTQEYYDTGGWKGTWKYDGGGALMNQGTHTIDLLQWLVGLKIKRVVGFTGLVGHKNIEVEDIGVASLEFENGAMGVIFGTTAMYPGQPSRVEIGGTDGTIISESTSLKVFQFREERPEDKEIIEKFGKPPAASGSTDPRAISYENHKWNFAEFLKALDENREPELNGEEARKAVQIVLAIYESARTGKIVEL